MNSKIQSLHKILKEKNLDALLISSSANIIDLTNYAGFSKLEREVFLLITEQQNYILTDLRYTEAVKEHIPLFTLIERKFSYEENFKQLFREQNIHSLGFEGNNITVSEYSMLSSLTSSLKLKPIALDAIRKTKAKDEVTKIQKACELGDAAYRYILASIKPEMTEKEIALKLELFIRKNGGELSFPTIVAFDKNSAVPHHHTGATKLKNNDVILLDFGVLYENYCSDMTRTCFIGTPTEEQKKVYQTVFDAQRKAIGFFQKSKTLKASDVDKAAREHIISEGYPSIPHALGHGIGIEVHEEPTISPHSTQTLTDGMVFSIEPGIYLSGKFGVRIEDLFTISQGKLLQLTHAQSEITSI